MHITSQITNLKKIRDVVGLRECYQCGGETLNPVVKHQVSDSTKVALTQNRTDYMSVTVHDLLMTFCDLLSNKVCSSGLWHILAQIHGKLIECMSIVIIDQCMS